MKKKSIIIKAPGKREITSDGAAVLPWVQVLALKEALLPYGTETAKREYGLTFETKWRMFTRNHSPHIRVGNQVTIDGETLYIQHRVDYGRMQDVIMGTDQVAKNG